MTIQEQISNNLKEAILKKDENLKSLLRVIIGEFNRVDKVISDDKALSILKKMHLNAVEQNNDIEISILENYLPKQYSNAELSVIIEKIKNDNNFSTIKDMGKIMSLLKENHSGKYDGKLANELVKKILNN